MSLGINLNSGSFDIQRSLTQINQRNSVSLNRLETGLRTESPKDDPAGFDFSSRYRSQIASMTTLVAANQENMTTLQIADGGTEKIQDVLIRMKNLVAHAAGGNGADNKISNEFEELKGEITNIVDSTKFNGRKLLAGDLNIQKAEFKATATSLDNQAVNTAGSSKADNSLTLQSFGIDTASLKAINDLEDSTKAADEYDKLINKLETAIDKTHKISSAIGASENKITYSIDQLTNGIENLSSSNSAIRDLDMANYMASFTKNQILQHSSVAMMSQANLVPQQVMSLLK